MREDWHYRTRHHRIESGDRVMSHCDTKFNGAAANADVIPDPIFPRNSLETRSEPFNLFRSNVFHFHSFFFVLTGLKSCVVLSWC